MTGWILALAITMAYTIVCVMVDEELQYEAELTKLRGRRGYYDNH